MAVFSLFLAASCLYYITNAQCIWNATVIGGTPQTLDFRCVSSETITLKDDSGHTFSFSLCGERVSCPSTGNMMMVNQVADNAPDLCYEIGYWDPSRTPSYSNANGGQFMFTYFGATDCSVQSGRQWEPTFICDSSVNGFSGDFVQEPSECEYTVNIRTKYACPGVCSGGGDPSAGSVTDDGLSGGWVFIICLIGAFFLYCVGGYLFMGLQVNKEQGLGAFNDNIPNKSFWLTCPKWVMAGCQVSFEYAKGLMNKDGGGDDGELVEAITTEDK